MQLLDWIIVGVYVLSAIGIGLFFTKKAAKSSTDFFVAGRSLPWIIAGTSIVATTFSSDTPIFVAGLTRDEGFSGNWFWWSGLIGGMAGVFFFAKLWRRTKALTDVEFVAQRYDAGPATNILRGFKVFFHGVFENCVIIASVTLAMSKVIDVILDLPTTAAFTLPFIGDISWNSAILILLGGVAVLYSTLSGLYGVVYTDLIQFALAMVGSISLAFFAYRSAGGGEGMMAKLQDSPDFSNALTRIVPDLSLNPMNIGTATFLILVTVMWWGNAPGQGYLVQRLLATKSERDSMLALLWFNFCHYVLRSWPWLTVGLLSLIYFKADAPELMNAAGAYDSERAFPAMIDMFLPVGLKGVMVASLLAAFMSTLDTHLNWGASYLVNDFYQPFINKKATTSQIVAISRWSMVVLTILAVILATKLTGIIDAYKYLAVIGGGLAVIMIARWFWWRVNAQAELAAVATSLVCGNLLELAWKHPEGQDFFAIHAGINLLITTAVWIFVAIKTQPEPTEQTIHFYQSVRVGGPGWGKIRQATGLDPISGDFGNSLIGWISGSTFIMSMLIGVGKLLFLEKGTAMLSFGISAVSFIFLMKAINAAKFNSPDEPMERVLPVETDVPDTSGA